MKFNDVLKTWVRTKDILAMNVSEEQPHPACKLKFLHRAGKNIRSIELTYDSHEACMKDHTLFCNLAEKKSGGIPEDLQEAINAAVEYFGEDCRYDHHGYCQEHGLMEKPCMVETLREYVTSEDDTNEEEE